MATLVALGPGDPDLVPLAAWRALEAAGPVAVPDDEPLAGWLGGHGIAALPSRPPPASASGGCWPSATGTRSSPPAMRCATSSCPTRCSGSSV
jgi:hypothetical protein